MHFSDVSIPDTSQDGSFCHSFSYFLLPISYYSISQLFISLAPPLHDHRVLWELTAFGTSGRIQDFQKGRSFICRQAAEGRRTEVCSADQSVQSTEKFFAFIFQLSVWGLVAPSCFAQQVPDVQDPGPPCASQISLTEPMYT